MVFNCKRRNFLREKRQAFRQKRTSQANLSLKKENFLTSPVQIFKPTVHMSTDLPTSSSSSNSSSPIIINSHQLKARKSNPNAKITISKQKKRALLRKLHYQGLLLDVEDAAKEKGKKVADPYDFLTRIVPVSDGIGTFLI